MITINDWHALMGSDPSRVDPRGWGWGTDMVGALPVTAAPQTITSAQAAHLFGSPAGDLGLVPSAMPDASPAAPAPTPTLTTSGPSDRTWLYVLGAGVLFFAIAASKDG